MQPVILAIVAVSGKHVHKTVVNIESVTGSQFKGVDVPPDLVINTDTKQDDLAVGNVQAMIREWEDKSNIMFTFKPGSKEEVAFKNSKRGACVKNVSKFSNVSSSHLASTLSSSPFVLIPISQAFG